MGAANFVATVGAFIIAIGGFIFIGNVSFFFRAGAFAPPNPSGRRYLGVGGGFTRAAL